MSRPQKEPLRALSQEERLQLQALVRAWNEPAAHVARARVLLALADGSSFTEAAKAAGRRSGDGVAKLVVRFNALGLAAIARRPQPGRAPTYDAAAHARILAEARRAPEPAQDGTATWSLSTLQRALRRAPDGLPRVSPYTIRTVLGQAGLRYGRTRSWCPTGKVLRKRKAGIVEVSDPDADAKKKRIEEACVEASKLGLALWTEDEAGPYQTAPFPGQSWYEGSQPPCQPHESMRNGTAKLLTLFEPATGQVRVQGVTSTPNAVLHPWMKRQLPAILETLPPAPPVEDEAANLFLWRRWQRGLRWPLSLGEKLPALRLLLVLDNLAGHLSVELVCWFFEHGIMPLYTPVGGSWLNMAFIHAAHPQAPRLGRPASPKPRQDHRPAGRYGGGLEPGADALRVGRTPCPTPWTCAAASPEPWRLRCPCHPPASLASTAGTTLAT